MTPGKFRPFHQTHAQTELSEPGPEDAPCGSAPMMQMSAVVGMQLILSNHESDAQDCGRQNKLRERKAWGTSLVAKSAQGKLVAITHNLMLIYECRLELEQGVSNVAEDQRRALRTTGMVKLARKGRRPPSSLLAGVRRATQRSVKFIRWLRHAVRENLTEAVAVPRLVTLYATL